MRIELDKSEFTVKTARIMNRDQVMEWSVAAFDRSNFDVEFDMFAHNNQYWAQLSQSEQDQIFALYGRMYDILSNSRDRENRIVDLIYAIEELYNIHDPEKLEYWIRVHSDIKMPAWIQQTYDQQADAHGSREQTYLLEDYLKLITLAFALRMLIPVWSEFIGRTKDSTRTALKEYRAYQLLAKSKIFHYEAMEKLRVYVNRILPVEKQKSAIIEGMSSEEFPVWLLSVALIRKVCISDIRGIFPPPTFSSNGTRIDPPTLVTFVFNHVKERIKHSGNNFSGIVANKENEGRGVDTTDQQMSKFEGYKIKQEVPPGDIVLLEITVEDPFSCAKILEPEIDLNLVQECLDNRIKNNIRILDPQFTMMQWIFKPIIPPKGMLYMNKDLIQQCLAVTEAVLWFRGHHLYSALCSAELETVDEDYVTVGITTDARIPKELNDEIIKYYPYMKKNTPSKSKTTRTMNSGYNGVNTVHGLFAKGEWKLTISDDRLNTLLGTTRVRQIQMPHDAKVKLVQLVIDIAKRSENTYNRYNQALS